jgi:exonuclease VII small subunit
MGSRNPEKEMRKNLTDFETSVKMSEVALKSAKTKLKKLREMKEKLETSYFSLNQSFNLYKADVILKECKTESAFNGKE